MQGTKVERKVLADAKEMSYALARAREGAGWIQEESAKRLGVQVQTIHFWETSKSPTAMRPLVYVRYLADFSPRAKFILADVLHLVGAAGEKVRADADLMPLIAEAAMLPDWTRVRRQVREVMTDALRR